MTKAAEDFENIARRLKELEAEKRVALTGSSASEAKEEVPSVESVYGVYGDYACGYSLTPCGYSYTAGNLTNIGNGNLSALRK